MTGFKTPFQRPVSTPLKPTKCVVAPDCGVFTLDTELLTQRFHRRADLSGGITRRC